jgi:hypothetical protein
LQEPPPQSARGRANDSAREQDSIGDSEKKASAGRLASANAEKSGWRRRHIGGAAVKTRGGALAALRQDGWTTPARRAG